MCYPTKKRCKNRGIALVVTMIFITVFFVMMAGMFSKSAASVQSSVSHHEANNALNAAHSGLECARYIIANTDTLETGSNTVSDAEADTIWGNLCSSFQTTHQLGGEAVASASRLEGGNGDQIFSQFIPYSSTGANFKIRFYRLDSDKRIIYVDSCGRDGTIARNIGLNIQITKDTRVLNYGIASRGRIWLAGDTTVYGSIYSAWNLSTTQMGQLGSLEDQLKLKLAAGTLNSTSFGTLVSSLGLTTTKKTMVLNELLNGTLSPKDAGNRCVELMSASTLSVAPFNMTSDSTVLGSINTCWTKAQVGPKSWQFETWDNDGNPMYQTDGNGDPLYVTDNQGNYLYDDNGDLIRARVIGANDEIQGVCAGINYGQPPQNLAGMNINDYYDSSGNSLTEQVYKKACTISNGGGAATEYTGSLESLGSTAGTKWRYEYFPHNAGSYTTGSGIKVKRYIYKDQAFTDQTLPANANALFVNCTFNGVLYIDCDKNTAASYNNVRFEDCQFNGAIVSNSPTSLNWQKNALYFTGSSTFNNQSSVKEATILAPNFNVNLGNANNGEVQSDENVLTGAIIGGIVDVRGNAKIYGTIISMADTSGYTSGYVSNIGATLGDGGSETTTIEDVGTIEITPDTEQMLPSGIKAPVVFKPLMNTYQEACN